MEVSKEIKTFIIKKRILPTGLLKGEEASRTFCIYWRFNGLHLKQQLVSIIIVYFKHGGKGEDIN